jgi:aminobenzoyl-glutamate transport protein
LNEHRENKRNTGWLGAIERIGNKLPHPVMIFIILAGVVILISEVTVRLGISVEYFDAASEETVLLEPVSMLSGEGIAHIFNSAVENFTGFAPLGNVLVALLGVGVAEWTGLIPTALKKMLNNVPNSLLTSMVIFVGLISNIASDAGFVVVIPLGAIIFAGAGRHPVTGLAAAFAGVSSGFSANLMIGPTDANLTGITNEALSGAGLTYETNVTANWFFIAVSVVLLTIVGTWVTERIVAPRLGEYTGDYSPDDEPITPKENKGLRNALLTFLFFLGIMGLLMIPQNAPLRAYDELEGAYTLNNFLSQGLLFMIFLLFALPGFIYGKTTGKIKTSHDIVSGMRESMSAMGGYLVLAFFAAQFIDYFSFTNLGSILAVAGAELLESIGFVGLPLIIAFILLSAFLNLFIGSASAKWAIMAPVFVPMLFELSISPEMTLMAYRIADSSTNIISPLMPYFPMVLMFVQRYDKKSGLGTLVSMMISYTLAFLLAWTILLIVWYLLGLPLGPSAPVLL